MLAGKAHPKMSILRRNLRQPSRPMGTATAGRKADPAPWHGEASLTKPHQPFNHSPSSSGDVDFDLFGFGFFVLRQVHLEDALLELSLYFIRVRVLRQRESSHKAAVAALHAVVFLLFLFFFELAFTRDSKNPVLDSDLNVLPS